MKSFPILLFALVLAGCSTSTRLNISPEEFHYHIGIRHNHPAERAFDETKLALAESFYDIRDVLPFSQLSSGTFIVNGAVSYRVGGVLGPAQQAPFRLKIVVTDTTITLDYTLGREKTSGWNSYAPKSEIPGIRSQFKSLATAVAHAVDGDISP